MSSTVVLVAPPGSPLGPALRAAHGEGVQTAPTWEAVDTVCADGPREIFVVEASAATPEHVGAWLQTATPRPDVLVVLDRDSPEAETAWLRAGTGEVLPAAALDGPDALRRALARAEARHAAATRRAWEDERYRHLVEHTFDIVAVLDAGGAYVYASPSVEEKLGYTPDELVGRNAFETVHPDDAERVAGVFLDAVAAPGTTRALEYRAVRKDGGLVDLEGVGRAVTGPEGMPYGVVNARDVTKRKAAEGALRASDARFRALLGALPDVIARLRDDGLVLDFHVPGAFETETFPHHVLGHRLQDVVGERLGGLFESAVARLRASGEPATYRYAVGLDSETKHREVRVVAVGPDEVLSILRDVTAEVAAADALHAQEAIVRQIVTAVPVVAFAFEPDGQITFAEGRGLAEVGAAPDALVGRSLFDVYGAYDGIVGAARRALSGEPATVVAEVRGRAFDAYLAPVLDGAGAVARVIGVAADVTELKEHQEALARQAEALEAQAADLGRSRADLQALTAHLNDIREEERARISREVHDVLGQALTAVRLGVGWLGRRLTGDAEAAGRVADTQGLIDETIRHVRQISADLRPGVLDDFGLVSALEWEATRFEARTGVACRFRSRGPERDVAPDTATAAFRIYQEALTNVARHAHASAVNVDVEAADDGLVLTVQDDGVGIGAAPDGSREGGRRSLGLLGMQERARILGGTVEVGRAPEGGTRVRVALPLVPPPAPEAAPRP